ncbi:hypothetical protein BsWGS_25916 [Bradybaena similaris]
MNLLRLCMCMTVLLCALMLHIVKVSAEINNGETAAVSNGTDQYEDDLDKDDYATSREEGGDVEIPSLDLSSCTITIGPGDNDVINLKPLGKQGYPRYNATFDVSIHQNKSSCSYFYDPCVPYSLPHDNPHNKDIFGDGCHNVLICKRKNESSRLLYYALGINSLDNVKVEVIAVTNKTAEASVMLVYTGIWSFRASQTKILLVCDKGRKGEDDGFFNVTSDDGQSSIHAELHHECCCAGGCWKQGLGASALADGEIILVVAGFLVGLLMLVALIGGLCYARRTHQHFYAKLPGVNPVAQNTNSTAMTLLANPKDGPSYPDFRDYEPAGLSTSKRKLIPVLSDSNIQIHTVEMGQRLGGGVFGDTHMAKWNEMTVTLKRLTLAIHNNQLTTDTMDWMKEEVWFLSRQRHKNIVCVIGLCLEGRLPFLLTEYVVGECVKDFLKVNGQLLTWPQRVRMCSQVADGMAFLHSTKPPIIHRDLRCGNLFLSDNDLVKVADFGLIKLLQPMREQCQNDDCSCQRQMSACPARIRWTAPELLMHPCSKEGQGTVITPACDVYSFGLVMLEMVVCKDPFDELLTGIEVMDIVRNGGRPDVPSSEEMMPQYRDLMKTCWDQRPELRPHFKQMAVKFKDLVGAARTHQKQINTNKQRLQKLQTQGLV